LQKLSAEAYKEDGDDRTPLLLALAVSPLYLLIPSDLSKKCFAKKKVLNVWIHHTSLEVLINVE
jgi:hypothetical protein